MTQTRITDGLPTLVAAAALVALLVAGIVPGVAAAEPSLTVTVDRTTIYRDQPLSVDIVISGDYDRIEGPGLEDFEILGRSEGRSISIGFGRPRSERTISLTLAPARAGRLQIGAARMMLDGKAVASSNPVEITVRDENAPASAQRQGNRSGRISLFPQFQPPQLVQPRVENVKSPIIEVRLSSGDRAVYPGETLTMKFVLLTPTHPDGWSASVTAKPEMEGLVVREAPRSQSASSKVQRSDGTWYETLVWKAAVSPLVPGEITITPYRMNLIYQNYQEFSIATEPAVIKVLPLPPDGIPEGFVPGTVGNFTMVAGLDDAVVAPGDSTTLSVAISGKGNIASIREPIVRVDDAIKVDSFANAQGTDEFTVGEDGLSGTRTFKFLLTPGRETAGGEFTVSIEPVVFFDPSTGTWGKAASDDIKLTVRGVPRVEKAEVVPAGVLGIVETSALADPPPREKTRLNTTVFIVLMALPVFALAASETVRAARRRLNRQGGKASARKALRRAMAELSRLERSTHDEARFWTSIEHLLRHYVRARFAVATAAMTPPDIAAAVSRAGAAGEACTELLELLEQCSLARFAGGNATFDRSEVCGRVGRCLAALDRSGGGVA